MARARVLASIRTTSTPANCCSDLTLISKLRLRGIDNADRIAKVVALVGRGCAVGAPDYFVSAALDERLGAEAEYRKSHREPHQSRERRRHELSQVLRRLPWRTRGRKRRKRRLARPQTAQFPAGHFQMPFHSHQHFAH